MKIYLGLSPTQRWHKIYSHFNITLAICTPSKLHSRLLFLQPPFCPPRLSVPAFLCLYFVLFSVSFRGVCK